MNCALSRALYDSFADSYEGSASFTTSAFHMMSTLMNKKVKDLLSASDPYTLIPPDTYFLFQPRPPNNTTYNQRLYDAVVDVCKGHVQCNDVAKILEYLVAYTIHIANNVSSDMNKKQISACCLVRAIILNEFVRDVWVRYLTLPLLTKVGDFNQIDLNKLTSGELVQYINVRKADDAIELVTQKYELYYIAKEYVDKPLNRDEALKMFKHLWRRIKTV